MHSLTVQMELLVASGRDSRRVKAASIAEGSVIMLLHRRWLSWRRAGRLSGGALVSEPKGDRVRSVGPRRLLRDQYQRLPREVSQAYLVGHPLADPARRKQSFIGSPVASVGSGGAALLGFWPRYRLSATPRVPCA